MPLDFQLRSEAAPSPRTERALQRRAPLLGGHALLEAAGDSGSVAECDAQLAQEIAKREMWSAENVRRHHNYVPLVVDLFKVLAERGKLADMISGAREKAASAKAK